MQIWKKIIVLPIVLFTVISIWVVTTKITYGKTSEDCNRLGWFPTEFGLKDHSVFYFDGYYYLVSIYLPGEQFFAYGRSTDLCHWEDLTPVLDQRTAQWDSLAIWAPHVIEDNGVYYMYYTGVKGPYPYLTQSIMLATTINPADPNAWVQQGMVFQPNHPDTLWEDGTWADCRDSMVLKEGNTYFMYYTGRDVDGGIIGLATATNPAGPWVDWGNILFFSDDISTRTPESPTVFEHNGFYYLFYNSNREHYRIGASPAGPWTDELLFQPGWAHEIWTGADGQDYASHLSDTNDEYRYTVTISPVNWDSFFYPPSPYIGVEIFHLMIPLLLK